MDNINFDIQSTKENYFESETTAYINPPKKIPFFLKLPMWIAKKKMEHALVSCQNQLLPYTVVLSVAGFCILYIMMT